MKISVLDAGTLGDDLDLSVFDKFGEVTVYQTTSADETVNNIGDSEVIIVNKVKITAAVLEKTAKLRLICIAATGFDNVDVAACKARGVAVCNVVGYSTDSVAQITVASAMWLCCRYGEYVPFVQSGAYSAGKTANKVSPPFYEFRGKTWGIVGYGNIGKQVGNVASALGCKIIVNKRSAVDGVDCVDIDTLCENADIISIHTPLNDGTRGLISAERIAKMKTSAVVINTARGAVTDEKALAEAVKEGRIAGLASDVYSIEPMPESHPFYEIKDYPNVCLTPHMAWAAYEARQRCLEEMVANIESFLAGGTKNRL